MIRDLLAAIVFMSGDPEPPRLQLGDLWPEDGKDADRSGTLMSARKAASPLPDGPQCSHCAGELVRSRVRAYERFLTYFTKTPPLPLPRLPGAPLALKGHTPGVTSIRRARL